MDINELTFFPSVNLIITNACRMRCEFCCAETKEHETIKSNIDNLKKIIKILSDNGTKRICFSGGEPLLNKNINETGKGKDFIKKNNRITEKSFEKLLDNYQNKYNKLINISGQRFNKNAQCVLVYANGNVYITPYENEEKQLLIGNLLKDEPKKIFLKIKNDENIWNDYIFRYKNLSILKKTY